MRRSMPFLFVVVLCLFSVLTSGAAVAQTPVPQQATLVAIGMGEASAPAASATLQFLLGSSMMFGMGPMPAMTESDSGSPEAGGPTPMDMSGQVSEETLQPVVEALIDSGIAEDSITIAAPAATDAFGPSGSVGEVRIAIEQPGEGVIVDAVDLVRDTAPSSGLQVLHVGAMFTPADCTALFQQAREAAIADAQVRVDGLAISLGGTLGALIQASESPGYGPYGVSNCGSSGQFSGPYGMNSLPSFDPSSPEATVYVQVTLTYAFETEG